MQILIRQKQDTSKTQTRSGDLQQKTQVYCNFQRSQFEEPASGEQHTHEIGNWGICAVMILRYCAIWEVRKLGSWEIGQLRNWEIPISQFPNFPSSQLPKLHNISVSLLHRSPKFPISCVCCSPDTVSFLRFLLQTSWKYQCFAGLLFLTNQILHTNAMSLLWGNHGSLPQTLSEKRNFYEGNRNFSE